MTLPALLLLCLALLCAAFAACRLLARRLENYGIIDILWTYSFLVVAILAAGFEAGWPVRRAAIAAMVALWSLRLGTHVLVRVVRAHPQEDPRYGELRREWNTRFEAKMTGFFQLQAFSVGLLSLPFFAACHNPRPSFGAFELAGALLWLAGVGGEAVADAQLAGFKRNPAHRGKICQTGLWRLSRHPNYFFEWTTWLGYFVFACGSPWGWLGVISPACILYFLLGVTGIPMTERQSLRSKGEAYRTYQRTTSAFVPWFPRTPGPAGGKA
jgi:steroid 5-alpha reductase family enzyme